MQQHIVAHVHDLEAKIGGNRDIARGVDVHGVDEDGLLALGVAEKVPASEVSTHEV
jgi:hypothetical protein